MSAWKIIQPEAATNLVTNPSLEAGIVGWSGRGGGETLSQSETIARRGVYSLKCIAPGAGAGEGVLFDVTAITSAATQYTFSIDARFETDSTYYLRMYDDVDGFQNGAVITPTVTEWDRYTLTATYGAASTLRRVYITQVDGEGAAAFTMYTDGMQLELNSYETTYIDGSQTGCVWNGAANDSTSTRNQFEATGGRVLNLSDDLGFIVSAQDGTGMPPVNNLSSALSLQPGALFDGQTIRERNFTLTGSVVGSTVADFHAKKQALVKILNPNVTTIGKRSQARTFRYTGGAVDKEIYAVYDGGLEPGLPIGFTEIGYSLRLKADDPLFYQVGESGAVLDTNDTLGLNAIVRKSNGIWAGIGTSMTSNIFAIAEDDVYLYIGGSFTSFKSIAGADQIVRRNKETGTYTAMGTGMDASVRAIVVGSDGTVYAGGDFTTADGGAAVGVASWNGSAWAAMGTGMNNDCLALGIGSDGTVYAGGKFTTADGGGANRIASWNGSAWAAMGTAFNNNVNGITIGPDDTVYAGGIFSTADGGAAIGVASWNGSTWSAMGSGVSGVSAMTSSPTGTVYAAGTVSGGVKEWDGLSWSTLGSGTNGTVWAIDYGSNEVLYACGLFTAAGGNYAGGYAEWRGSFWNSDLRKTIQSFEVYYSNDGDVYLAAGSGTLNFPGDVTVSYNGTYTTDPLVEVKRTGGTSAMLRRISNTTTGAELFFNYALQDGETLTIDARAGKQSISSSISGDVYSALLPNSDFGNFFLMPSNSTAAQDNIITAFVDEVGSPTVTATMIWRDAYISED